MITEASNGLPSVHQSIYPWPPELPIKPVSPQTQSQTPTIMAQDRKMQNGRAHPQGIWEAFLGRGVGANPGRKGESA